MTPEVSEQTKKRKRGSPPRRDFIVLMRQLRDITALTSQLRQIFFVIRKNQNCREKRKEKLCRFANSCSVAIRLDPCRVTCASKKIKKTTLHSSRWEKKTLRKYISLFTQQAVKKLKKRDRKDTLSKTD